PTPVQAAALPFALDGIDVIGVAQTGTGKTAAFVLPILDYLVKEPLGGRKRAVRALIVTPTRELALQIDASVLTYGTHTGLRSATVYGGVGKGKQKSALKSGVDIVVATPGRLLDLHGEGVLDLSWVDILVLDEADRMLDMGFLRDVKKIVAAVPEDRQTLLFSATMPSEIQSLAKTVLYRPETVEVGERRDPATTVAQQAVRVAEKDKQHLLQHLLENEPIEKAIVFTRTKYRADRVRKKLDRAGFSAIAIHSNRTQGQRQRALKGFEDGQYRVLVATDIAARGIDIEGVTHVVNFDAPNVPEDYIHRIGRTGRADATGDAITFVSAAETDHLRSIETHTGRPLARETYGSFAKGAEAETPPEAKPKATGGSRGGRRGQAPRGDGKRKGHAKGQGHRRR
ncbi:MAG: DEAD/DEAH box helicase, partial [Bacteroidota bacterium]